MKSYKNKKVVIMGLGQIAQGSGVSAALFLAKQKAKVVVTDLRSASKLNPDIIKKLKKHKNIKLVLGKHNLSDFKNADLIVKNPAVKPTSEVLQQAKKHKIKILTDLGLFFEYIQNKLRDEDITIIGITGTRGKSTTTALAYEILKAKYKSRVYLGGNIGNSPLNFMHKLKKGDIVVMEVASFQLNDLDNHHFDIAVVTNIMPDHLDYYKNIAHYQKDKEKIFAKHTEKEYLLLNKDDKKTKAMAKKTIAKTILFSKNKKVKLKDVKLLGEHSLYNIEAAWQIAKLLKVPDKIIKKAVVNFSGVKDRLQFIRSYKGVKFYNDCASTHPAATVAALKALPKNKIILISGGNSKNLALTEMNKAIKQRVRELILVPGNANNKLPTGTKVKDINQAVKKSWQLAKTGDVILFSPGLTWLPKINEFKRGEQFVKIVKRIS